MAKKEKKEKPESHYFVAYREDDLQVFATLDEAKERIAKLIEGGWEDIRLIEGKELLFKRTVEITTGV